MENTAVKTAILYRTHISSASDASDLDISRDPALRNTKLYAYFVLAIIQRNAACILCVSSAARWDTADRSVRTKLTLVKTASYVKYAKSKDIRATSVDF